MNVGFSEYPATWTSCNYLPLYVTERLEIISFMSHFWNRQRVVTPILHVSMLSDDSEKLTLPILLSVVYSGALILEKWTRFIIQIYHILYSRKTAWIFLSGMRCCTVQKSNVEQLNLNCGVRYTSLRTLELFKLKTYITVYLLLPLLPSLVKKKYHIIL